MGKSRRNRAGSSKRPDPISKPIKPPSDPELAALRGQKILPVLQDLKSLDPKLRQSAAAAVANLVEDARCRKLFLREQIVRIVLTETLTDSALESRAAGWEILRVLAAEEEADFCVHLFRQDILGAITFAAKLIADTIQATSPTFASATKGQKDVVWNITTSLLFILNAVVESNDECLETIPDDANIVDLLFLLISSDQTPEEVVESALTCLWTLSEDNERLAARITTSSKSPLPLDTLLRLVPTSNTRAILACGILHNTFATLGWHDQASPRSDATDKVLIAPLSAALKRFENTPTITNGHVPSTPDDVQLALEILALIGTDLQHIIGGNTDEEDDKDVKGPKPPKRSEVMDQDGNDNEEDDDDDDEDDDEATKDEDDDDEMDADEMDADMAMVLGDNDNDGMDDDDGISDLPTLKELCQHAIPELVRLANLPTETSSPEALEVRDRTMSALNNITWSLACVDFSEENNAGIAKAWEATGRAIWQNAITPVLSSETADVALATKVTSLAWAVARTMRGQFGDDNEHRKFISLYQATKTMPKQNLPKPGPPTSAEPEEDPFQSLGVMCIGVLGQLALHPCPPDRNREIGIFLMTTLMGLPHETPVADAVEALDQLYDIYGDEEYAYDAAVFWKDDFVAKLDAVQPKLKQAIKKVDKRANSELRTRADEAIMNLSRFVQYKRKNKPQQTGQA